MSYKFDGVSIKNTVTKEYWDCRDPHELEELTKHLNVCYTILQIYNNAIRVNKDGYHKGSTEPMLLPKTREKYNIKYEALVELQDKIELIKKSEGIYDDE